MIMMRMWMTMTMTMVIPMIPMIQLRFPVIPIFSSDIYGNSMVQWFSVRTFQPLLGPRGGTACVLKPWSAPRWSSPVPCSAPRTRHKPSQERWRRRCTRREQRILVGMGRYIYIYIIYIYTYIYIYTLCVYIYIYTLFYIYNCIINNLHI